LGLLLSERFRRWCWSYSQIHFGW